MKTHQEIHDAITARSQLPHAADLDSIWDILHAMNDRILDTRMEFANYALNSELRELERRLEEIHPRIT